MNERERPERLNAAGRSAINGDRPAPLFDEMPLCGGGFDDIAVARLRDVNKLLGIDGGVALDTGVIAHWLPPDPDEDNPPYDHEIVVAIGVSGRPITIEDVARALLSIPRDAWQQGRSYYWEGLALSPDRRGPHVKWGS